MALRGLRCKIRGGIVSPPLAMCRELKKMKMAIPIDASVSEIILASAIAWQMRELFHKNPNEIL